MTHVVAENCIQCKYTDCVEVCPVDCFVEGPNFLAIDPVDCIDCGLCIIECTAKAIYAEAALPPGQAHMIALNAELAKRPGWKVLTKRKAPLPDADAWNGKDGKLAELMHASTRLTRRLWRVFSVFIPCANAVSCLFALFCSGKVSILPNESRNDPAKRIHQRPRFLERNGAGPLLSAALGGQGHRLVARAVCPH